MVGVLGVFPLRELRFSALRSDNGSVLGLFLWRKHPKIESGIHVKKWEDHFSWRDDSLCEICVRIKSQVELLPVGNTLRDWEAKNAL